MAVYINAGSIRVGYLIIYDKQLWRVMAAEHVKPGKGGAYAQVKLRNVIQGNQTEVRLRTEEKVERAALEQHEMEYLYEDPAGHCFMNTETYEQIFLSGDILEGTREFLLPNTKVKVEYYDGKPLGVEPPRVVELTVTETSPVMKTATITSSPKPAKLETGLSIMVPQFVATGDKVRVDTMECKYIERVK
ncbi:MAG: elongation factor P [Nitrospinae bacterium]|nr:elongation factor P [Nitrospinota bacterium]